MTVRYRQVTFYYYTGSGNSRRVAAWMADAVRATGSAVIFSPLQSANPADDVGHGENALLVLVMPTHAFTAPWAVLRFALGLPRRKGTDAAVVATRGGLKIGQLYTPGFEGTATSLVALILAAKGYRVQSTEGIDMPSNWTALHPALPRRAVDGIIDHAQRKTARLSAEIISGAPGFANWRASLLGVLVLPLSLGYLLCGRFFLAKLFFASDDCTGCRLCAERCPNDGIALWDDGVAIRPYWTFRCQSCMRCMAYCPTQAVEASHMLAAVVLLLAGSLPTGVALSRLTAWIPSLRFLRMIPRWVLHWGTGLALLTAAYRLSHFLLRSRAGNWLFTHTTLTHAYRRYREPSTRVEDLWEREPPPDGGRSSR